jgi:hypothetical protein
MYGLHRQTGLIIARSEIKKSIQVPLRIPQAECLKPFPHLTACICTLVTPPAYKDSSAMPSSSNRKSTQKAQQARDVELSERVELIDLCAKFGTPSSMHASLYVLFIQLKRHPNMVWASTYMSLVLVV